MDEKLAKILEAMWQAWPTQGDRIVLRAGCTVSKQELENGGCLLTLHSCYDGADIVTDQTVFTAGEAVTTVECWEDY